MKTLNLTLFLVFSTLFGGCDANHSAAMNNRNSAIVQQTVSTNANAKSKGNVVSDEANTAVVDSENGNEITDCLPQKVYRGETFRVSFKKPHGQNFAIYNEKTRDFYFLTANGQDYFPFISPDEFEKRAYINLDTLAVRNPSEELDSDGDNKSKPYFTKTGWYRVIIGHQALDVDFIDMPVTGSCRIYYVNKKRPKGKLKT